jgi:hypothetical protein
MPVLLYHLTKHYLAASEFTALSVAALFPLGMSIVGLIRSRTLDPVALVSLLSILFSIVAVSLGGSTKLLLIRESLFTAAFGIVCFVSLALPRPLMFYFGRHFTAGRDQQRLAEFNAGWQRPEFRRVNRAYHGRLGSHVAGRVSRPSCTGLHNARRRSTCDLADHLRRTADCDHRLDVRLLAACACTLGARTERRRIRTCTYLAMGQVEKDKWQCVG